MKILLRIFGCMGLLIFLPLFFLTFADPQLIENSGRSFIEWQLNKQASNKIDAIELPKETKLEKLLGDKAVELRQQADSQLALLREQLKADLPALLADQIAKLRDLDCECRQKWEARLRDALVFQIASLEATKEKLIDFSQAKYMEIVHQLTLDVRIFLGSNVMVFLLLLLASLFKPQAVRHLFLPGALLLCSTLICSYFYLFEQNWFYTIIYNDYTGFAFLGYLGFVFALLCDITMNRARITTEIINGILSALGQVGSLVPC